MESLKFFRRLVFLAIISTALPVLAQTTPPPKSDTIDDINNFLACYGNKFSLCYYSGPESQPGQEPMPCEVGEDGSQANCKCYSYDDGDEWNYVAIGSILNADVRAETQAETACGVNGESCLNLGNQAKCGFLGEIGRGECKIAPVCTHLGAGGDEPGAQTLYPKLPGDYSISTFSFRHAKSYPIGSTPCADGLYAGCMTAPCELDEETGYSSCDCPTYEGEFQIGQTLDSESCQLFNSSKGKHVWSAANVDISD